MLGFDAIGMDAIAMIQIGATVIVGNGGTFVRAPIGPGYMPRQNEREVRPMQERTRRPAATQRNNR